MIPEPHAAVEESAALATAAQATPSAQPAPSRYRRWLRFSLLNFLLASALICVCVSHFVISRRVAWLEEERERLRSEAGLLTIVDPTQINVIEVPVREERAWRWRMHLPKGAHYGLFGALADIPIDGFPATPHPNCILLLVSDEVVVDGYVHRGIDGNLLFTLNSTHGSMTSLLPGDSSWLYREAPTSSSSDATYSTKVFAPNTPVVLLRHRIQKKATNGGGVIEVRSDPEPTDGLLIWLQPFHTSGL